MATISPLATHVQISPNKTKNRSHEIDTVTIHCTAGQCSVESLGNLFAKSSKQSSSNADVSTGEHI